MRVHGYGRALRLDAIRFTFDGRPVEGRAGDTVASALLASGRRVMARSFKYHRPRGPLTCGSEEPNALVEVGEGLLRVPNVRATVQEAYEGLTVRSQNAWPSLERDALAINDYAAPFIGAGFYYKTFMWPRPFWERVYEPLIRRAAGLGGLDAAPTPDESERAFAFCDVLVIGGGPAGLMAALTAARAGADVILATEEALWGGRLASELEEVGGRQGFEWAEVMAAELRELGARLMTRTTVTGAYDDGVYGALERVGLHEAPREDRPPECFWRIQARQAVLAAGSIERLIAFADNDRPGIMTAGALRAYLHRYGVAPGGPVAVFGNTDDAHRTARDLAAAGVAIAAVIDARPEVEAQGDWPVHAGAQVIGTRGRMGVREVTIRDARGEHRVEVAALAVSGGWNPSVHLSCHRNGRPVWREDIAAFVPAEGAVPGLHPCGAAAGVFSTAGCLADGVRAGRAALGALGIDAQGPPLPRAEDGRYDIAPLWHVPGLGRAWLDLQNDVTVKDVGLAAQERFTSVEHMKRYTTQGMAPDQGKTSNVVALAVLADVTGRSIPETGTTTYRPPFVPVSIAAMGAGASGRGFAPDRRTTSHEAALARGAPMIEAGLWHRPSHFPRAGEPTWREACDREVAMVREAVGVCDVSTLGKIDVQGPDAAAFLDLLYANRMATLAPGRVRYGLMLREDGFVMDDGTVARLGEQHYVLTTTTAAAGAVTRHMEFVHQVLRAHLDLRLACVTEAWAQFALAGPRSGEVLAALAGEGALPYMACRAARVAGVEGRLFAISFSGERAFEVAVPARYGAALFERLVAEAEARGGGPYGMEALNVLRIEKGYLTHAEIHGRIVMDDLGLSRMVKEADHVGRAAATRPGLSGPGREQLVGLRAEGRLLAGAHLFAPGATATREADRGYVTSACWSPTLRAHLGLGFLKDGRARMGERVRMVDHLRGVETLAEVCHPVFLDPDGARLRG